MLREDVLHKSLINYRLATELGMAARVEVPIGKTVGKRWDEMVMYANTFAENLDKEGEEVVVDDERFEIE